MAPLDIPGCAHARVKPEEPCAGVANGLLETPRTQLRKQAKMTKH